MRLCERPDTQSTRADSGLRWSGLTWHDVPVRSSITRRGLLRGLLGVTGVAGVSLAAGCDLFDTGSGTPPPPNPLESFLVDTAALLARYNQALAQVPALGPTITHIRDTHLEHANALAKALNAPSPAPSAGGSGAPSGDRATVLAALVDAETKGHDAAVQACLATDARLAPLVGSIAAARATHLEVLR